MPRENRLLKTTMKHKLLNKFKNNSSLEEWMGKGIDEGGT